MYKENLALKKTYNGWYALKPNDSNQTKSNQKSHVVIDVKSFFAFVIIRYFDKILLKETIIWRLPIQTWLQASNNTGMRSAYTRLWLKESEQATPVDWIKDVRRSFMQAPEFDKHLKKAGGHIVRNILNITIKLATVVEGYPKAPFSIATTLRCRRGRHFFPGLLHFTLETYLIMLSAKQGGIKYHFLSLWYDSIWDLTPVSRTIRQTLYH